MRELKVKVGFNSENRITYIEPKNRAAGKTVEHAEMLCRLVTPEEEEREFEMMMQEGRTYKRVNRRIREIR